MYHHANRGTGIGGWKVLRFDAGYAELEKMTPHHCVMEQGILSSRHGRARGTARGGLFQSPPQHGKRSEALTAEMPSHF
jgi:hypothetical protein